MDSESLVSAAGSSIKMFSIRDSPTSDFCISLSANATTPKRFTPPDGRVSISEISPAICGLEIASQSASLLLLYVANLAESTSIWTLLGYFLMTGDMSLAAYISAKPTTTSLSLSYSMIVSLYISLVLNSSMLFSNLLGSKTV